MAIYSKTCLAICSRFWRIGSHIYFLCDKPNLKITQKDVYLKNHTLPVVHFSRGCMDFKWSSPISQELTYLNNQEFCWYLKFAYPEHLLVLSVQYFQIPRDFVNLLLQIWEIEYLMWSNRNESFTKQMSFNFPTLYEMRVFESCDLLKIPSKFLRYGFDEAKRVWQFCTLSLIFTHLKNKIVQKSPLELVSQFFILKAEAVKSFQNSMFFLFAVCQKHCSILSWGSFCLHKFMCPQTCLNFSGIFHKTL